MANASAKRIASQNDKTILNLRLTLVLSTTLCLLLRFLLRRESFTARPIAVNLLLSSPAFFLYRYLATIGDNRRDAATGALLSSGEDLSQGGITEWCFDIIYVTCACQVGSAVFGDRLWYLYLVIPIYGAFSLWTSFLAPMLGRSASDSVVDSPADKPSKRQEKLRKRSERGDPRIRTTSR